MKQSEAFKKREELFNWFKRYTFGNCSEVNQIIVTRDTVKDFERHNPDITIVHRIEEQPCGYEVYAGFGLIIVDSGEFRFVFKD
jgi:hypothetical protein